MLRASAAARLLRQTQPLLRHARPQVTIALIKELRELTGAPINRVKQALDHSDGDLEEARQWLRTKGMADAAKKSGRETTEGLVVVSAVDERRVGLAEILCETDSVARNEEFQGFARGLAAAAAQLGSGQALTADAGLAEEIALASAKFGENLQLKHARCVQVPEGEEGMVAVYVHSAIGNGVGSILSAVALAWPEGSALDAAELAPRARQLAMQVTAASPQFLDRESVPEELVAAEQETVREQLGKALEGKPEHIQQKMMSGKLGKFFERVTLHDQKWVIGDEGKQSVSQVLSGWGEGVRVTDYVRLEKGSG